jgi:hypothetical protein
MLKTCQLQLRSQRLAQFWFRLKSCSAFFYCTFFLLWWEIGIVESCVGTQLLGCEFNLLIRYLLGTAG